MSNIVKLTISLPQELVSFADALAKERKISRSRAIADALQELAHQQEQDKMIEGYKAMAEQNKEFAAIALPSVSEVLPEWK